MVTKEFNLALNMFQKLCQAQRTQCGEENIFITRAQVKWSFPCKKSQCLFINSV